MKVTATKGYKKAVFIWDECLEVCSNTSIEMDDEEIQNLVDNKVHEGSDLEGWEVKIKL